MVEAQNRQIQAASGVSSGPRFVAARAGMPLQFFHQRFLESRARCKFTHPSGARSSPQAGSPIFLAPNPSNRLASIFPAKQNLSYDVSPRPNKAKLTSSRTSPGNDVRNSAVHKGNMAGGGSPRPWVEVIRISSGMCGRSSWMSA
jgi:hypothetical protein